jgi:outer membrane protein OmpA-like peptidoglycan-associated protein
MSIIRHTVIVPLVLCGLLGSAVESSAQLERLRQRAKDKIEQKAGEKVGRAIDKAGDGTPATPNTPANAAPVAGARTAGTGSPGEGAWVNYDFIPGARPLFVDDFTRDEVGNFPRRLELGAGNMEIAEWRGTRFLRVTSRPGKLAIVLPEQLPERFTLEFDATAGYPNDYIIFRFADRAAEEVHFRGFAGKGQGGVSGRERQNSLGQTTGAVGATDVFRGRIMADGRYVKVYINDTRVANVPNAEIGRSNRITVQIPGNAEHPAFFGNLSVMAGGKKLYDALAADGRVATQGILFDTGSDRIRPESTPTLKEITAMLKEHGDLKLMIEGHTDNVGQAASNRALSEKRAAAVKAYLAGQGIAAARLESQGLGDTKPAAKNDTPEGRQTNRRVELVRR